MRDTTETMAFKSEVAISDLESNFKNIANNAVVKSDLYNKLDYSTAGQKALDAAAGKTLNTKIYDLYTKTSNRRGFCTSICECGAGSTYNGRKCNS